MSDFRVIVTVKNGRLLRAMKAAGYETVVAMSAACSVSKSHVYEFLSLKRAPYGADGKPTPSARRLADALYADIDDLFPANFLHQCLERNRVERDVDAADFAALMGAEPPSIAYEPERSVMVQDALSALEATLAKVPERRQRAIRLYYGLDGGKARTLEEVAHIMGVTRERVRQMITSGERIMKDPKHHLRTRATALLDGSS